MNITFDQCPGCTARIRALDGVILYPHDAEACRLSKAYSAAPSDDERDRIIRAMQHKTDLENGQTAFYPPAAPDPETPFDLGNRITAHPAQSSEVRGITLPQPQRIAGLKDAT